MILAFTGLEASNIIVSGPSSVPSSTSDNVNVALFAPIAIVKDPVDFVKSLSEPSSAVLLPAPVLTATSSVTAAVAVKLLSYSII